MSPETVDVVMGIIERIADVLEPSAQAVWQIAMRQVMVQTIVAAVWTVLLGAGSVGGVRLVAFLVGRATAEDAGLDSFDYSIGAGFAGLITVCLVILCAVSLGELVGRLVNPAYYAIMALLKTAGAG